MRKTQQQERSGKWAAGLYLVASPIGNAADISLRALETLHVADAVYCEDTRHSQKLFALHGVHPKKLLSAHAHNEEKAAAEIVARVKKGEVIAYLSDAGMPLISDPGAILVKRLVEEGLPVTSLPGANAALAALQLSSLPAQPFYFFGFLPSREKEREKTLENLKHIPATLVFYEAPHRLLESLQSILLVLGNRQAALARELTKLHEELLRGNLESLIEALKPRAKIRGECVIVVGPPKIEAKEYGQAEIDKLLKTAAKTLSSKDAAADIAKKTGLKKRDLYQRLIELGPIDE